MSRYQLSIVDSQGDGRSRLFHSLKEAQTVMVADAGFMVQGGRKWRDWQVEELDTTTIRLINVEDASKSIEWIITEES